MSLPFLLILAVLAATTTAAKPPAKFRMLGGDKASIQDYLPLASLAVYDPEPFESLLPSPIPGPKSRAAPPIVISDGYQNFCGGTIIHREWVLTAAHCLDDKMKSHEQLRIFVGFSNLSPGIPLNEAGQGVFHVADVVIHPEYSKKFLLSDDVALVRIKGDFGGREVASFLTESEDLIGKEATAFGWGSTKATETGSTLELLQMTEKIYNPPADLELGIEMRNKGGLSELDEQLIFFGTDPGRGACHGDSGGPLVLSENKKLIGVTSFVNETCGGYSYFQKLSRHIPWIETTTGDKVNVNGSNVVLAVSIACLFVNMTIVVWNAVSF